jgi:hypothetical protein
VARTDATQTGVANQQQASNCWLLIALSAARCAGGTDAVDVGVGACAGRFAQDVGYQVTMLQACWRSARHPKCTVHIDWWRGKQFPRGPRWPKLELPDRRCSLHTNTFQCGTGGGDGGGRG